MQLNELKKYLEFIYKQELQQKLYLQDEYKRINSIEQLSPNQMRKLKRKIKIRKKGIKKIIPISEAKAIKEYKEKELEKISIKLTKINFNLDQISNAISAIHDNRFIKPIYPNNEVIPLIIEYAVKNNIDSKELLKVLLTIFKNIPKIEGPKDSYYNIEKEISTIFTEDAKVKTEYSFTTVKFNIFKLLELTNVDQNKNNIVVYINLLLNQLELEYYDEHIIESKKLKEVLTKRKKAIEQLKEFYDGTKIIKGCKNSTFEKILSDLNINSKAYDTLLHQMKEYNNKKDKNKEEKQLINTTKKYFKDDELNTILQAYKIINNDNNPEQTKIIDRTLHDVISLCRYLELEMAVDNYHETMEILYTKIRALKVLVAEYASPNNSYQTNFLFLSNENNVPHIISDITLLDDMLYGNVYKLFSQIKFLEEKQYDTIEDIPIYVADDGILSLFYTIINDKKVILKVTTMETQDRIYSFIKSHIKEINDIKEKISTEIEISGIQAKLVDIELNLNNSKKEIIVKKFHK